MSEKEPVASLRESGMFRDPLTAEAEMAEAKKTLVAGLPLEAIADVSNELQTGQ